MAKTIEIKYQLGDHVFLKTDREQLPRIVTGICYRTNGVSYNLATGTSDTWHYDVEITENENILLKIEKS